MFKSAEMLKTVLKVLKTDVKTGGNRGNKRKFGVKKLLTLKVFNNFGIYRLLSFLFRYTERRYFLNRIIGIFYLNLPKTKVRVKTVFKTR